MIESGRPEHSFNFGEMTFDQDGEVWGDRGKRLRPWCELDIRWEEWPEMDEKNGEGRECELLHLGTGVDGHEE
eukprot:12784161-Prorocentrum_lima.AAC.1